MAGKMSKAAKPAKNMMKELGAASGYRFSEQSYSDEFSPMLRGNRGIKKYREMRDNDATVGAILSAMDMTLRSVPWRVTPAIEGDEAAQAEADFAESLFNDMSHTFEDFLSNVLSFLPFGWSFVEIVMKKRVGPNEKDPTRQSRYTDGRIGIRKLAPRAQWTLERFKIGDDGGVEAFEQLTDKGVVSIPIEKGLLFRTTTVNNSPTGRSVLRNAFVPYYYMSNIQRIEAIAIERELTGLPIIYIPGEYLQTTKTAEQQAFYNQIESIGRDVKFNDQGFVVLPSDLYTDEEGKLSSHRMVEMELIASQGTRAIDTSSVITRYQKDIARTVLADFIMLGQSNAGSFALSKDKTDLFLTSLTGYLDMIAAVLNRFLLPRVWSINGLNFDLMPTYTPGQVAPEDIEKLGAYLRNIAGAGMTLFPDDDLENELRGVAGLPEKPEEDNDMLATSRGPDTEEEDDD